MRIGSSENISSHGRREVQPHAEESEPGADLNGREPAHSRWHVTNGGQDLTHIVTNTRVLGVGFTEAVEIVGWIFVRGHDGPQHGSKKHGCTHIEGEPHW